MTYLEYIINTLLSSFIGGIVSLVMYHYYDKIKQRKKLIRLKSLSTMHQKMHSVFLEVDELFHMVKHMDEESDE